MPMTIDRPVAPVTIDRPPCPTCATPMWLTRISPHKPDHDERTFECPVCEIEHMAVVKYR